MDWLQTITIIFSILIPVLAGFFIIIRKLRDLEKRMITVEDRLRAIEARLVEIENKVPTSAPHIYAISDRLFH